MPTSMKRMTSHEMMQEYTVEGFSHGICVVRRKADGVLGTLDFDHHPRFYYNFVEEAVN